MVRTAALTARLGGPFWPLGGVRGGGLRMHSLHPCQRPCKGRFNWNCLFRSSLQNQRNIRAFRRAIKTPQIHYTTEAQRGRTSATTKKNLKTSSLQVLFILLSPLSEFSLNRGNKLSALALNLSYINSIQAT